VVDPSSAYENLSQNPLAVDYVQFPRQTLQFRAGDCDDLSATYAALLEAVGVDTAFITVPGHIFMAFLLDMPADEAQSAFSRPQDLIIREDGSVWVPIETTVLEAGFNDAWAEGARQWREHAPEGRAGFFRTREAWNTYQPVAFSVSNVTIVPPREDRIATRFERTLKSFIDREIYDQAQRYAGILRRNPGDTRTRNRLGVLYARYGRHREARAEFQAVLARETYAPALVNLGNIAFVESSFGEAKEYYDRALEVTPYSGPALLGAARAASRLEDYEAARVSYERLARVDLELAERFAHLDPSQSDAVARASGEEALQRVLVWEEEE
jgi:tetratricopeptide (TPR) repeat protein